MLHKSLEQAGGIETQSQGDPCGCESGVCIACLTILMPEKNLSVCPMANHLVMTHTSNLPGSSIVYWNVSVSGRTQKHALIITRNSVTG